VNFGVIFGMGNAKMRATLVKDLSGYDPVKIATRIHGKDKKDAAKAVKELEVVQSVITALRKYLLEDMPVDQVDLIFPDTLSKQISIQSLGTVAPKILEVYHREAPEIKQLQIQVKEVIRVRGYVRNFYGRRYYLTTDKSYIGLNRIVQGTAASAFKRVCNSIIRKCAVRCPSMRMVNNIHDAVKAIVHLDEAQEYYNVVKEETELSPFKVPLRSDVEVALYNWGNYVKVDNNDVLGTLGKVLDLPQKEQ
jgi:hypothetical protein